MANIVLSRSEPTAPCRLHSLSTDRGTVAAKAGSEDCNRSARLFLVRGMFQATVEHQQAMTTAVSQ